MFTKEGRKPYAIEAHNRTGDLLLKLVHAHNEFEFDDRRDYVSQYLDQTYVKLTYLVQFFIDDLEEIYSLFIDRDKFNKVKFAKRK